MSETEATYVTTGIEDGDVEGGFACGERALVDYFARHALPNHRAGIGRTYVLRRAMSDPQELPGILGFYTLSMASVQSAHIEPTLRRKLPKYPLPVALIGRLAVDARAQGRRLGETLLIDALHRVVDASAIIGCMGIVVDAKHEGAERFYAKYDFVTVADDAWPHRMFMPIATARAALADE